MKKSGSVIVECTNPFWATYIIDNGNLTNGRWGNSPTDAGVPLIPGLQYRVTFEIVGTGKDRPQLQWYWRNWAGPKEQARARNYFKNKKEQRKFPAARKHMRAVLEQAVRSRCHYQRDLRIWKMVRAKHR